MVSRPLISEEVANKIKAKIIRGEIQVGERLPAEQELAAEYNVSIRSIREAVRYLVSYHIVEIRRGIGTFVCSNPGISDDPLGFDFMNLDVLYPDLIEIRLMLEPEIFVLAAHRGKKRDFNKAADILKDIQKMNLQMAQSNSAESDEQLYKKFWEYDISFHCCFYQASQNEIANRILPLILNTIRNLYQSPSFKSFRKSPDFYSRHQAILNAVLAKDDNLIRQLCRLHIRSGSQEGKLLLKDQDGFCKEK